MDKILQTPSIKSITTFDSKYEKTIDFIYLDNQSIKNRAVITDNSTGKIIYDKEMVTMKLYHTIPPSTLTNGKPYLIQIQVFDADGNSSNLSAPVLFYCLSTPQFVFNNIIDGQIYRNGSIKLELTYSQSDGEPLKNFQFFKYSYDKNLMQQSNILYSSSPMSYVFQKLENEKTYYFRAIGETNHGFQLDTGYIEINIVYEQQPLDVLFKCENNRYEGYIRLDTKIVVIGYELKNDNYVIKDGMLTLTDNWLKYNSGFKADGDFILFIEAKKIPLGKFFTTNDDIFSLEIVEICGDYYCHLLVKDSNVSLFSPMMPRTRLYTDDECSIITDNEEGIETINISYDIDTLIMFEIKRVNGIYGLSTYFKSDIPQEKKEDKK